MDRALESYKVKDFFIAAQICKDRIRGNTLIKELIVCPAKQRLVAW